MPGFWERLKRSWNVFRDVDERLPPRYNPYYGGYSERPDRTRYPMSNPRTIIQTIQNKMAVDCAQIQVNHVRLNDEGQFEEILDDELNRIFSFEANIDQTGPELIQDAVMSMFQDGVTCIVPVDTDGSIWTDRQFKVFSARVGRILEWFPDQVRVDLYNERTGQHQQIVVPKRACVIVQNPFYEIMNAPNSTVARLRRLIGQLETSNDQVSSDKIDLIVQLPYSLKSEARQVQAETRRKAIEAQLVNSKYGIAYIDATEHVTQLNRSLENNLWNQVKDLTQQVYNELGLTQSIFDGTANEQTLLDYYNRSIDPILSRLAQNIERKWLSDTARTQRQAIRYFRDPFKLVPVNNIAEIADKFTRNEIMSSNEIRSVVGLKPSKDPKADQLVNANLNQSKEQLAQQNGEAPTQPEGEASDIAGFEIQNEQ